MVLTLFIEVLADRHSRHADRRRRRHRRALPSQDLAGAALPVPLETRSSAREIAGRHGLWPD
jgi:hypothetical protein